MSKDTIKRSDAAEVVYKALKTPPLKGVLTDTMSLAVALVQDIPSADRPQGKWIQKKQSIDGKYDFIWTECSECHQRPHDDFESDFCPNCGAKMKGTDDE